MSSASEARYWRHYSYHWYGHTWSGSRPNSDERQVEELLLHEKTFLHAREGNKTPAERRQERLAAEEHRTGWDGRLETYQSIFATD